MIAKVKEVLLESLESESGYIRGGDDLLAAFSDGGILKHIHHSLAHLSCITVSKNETESET